MNKMHYILGYGGLIPFIGLALISLLFPKISLITFILVTYAALIYSFIGGIYWATTFNSNQNKVLYLSVFMMLWGWLWVLAEHLILNPPYWIMAISFWILPIIEYRSLRQTFSAEFLSMRKALSIIAGLSLLSLSFN